MKDEEAYNWYVNWLASSPTDDLMLMHGDQLERIQELANAGLRARNKRQVTKIRMAGSDPSDGDTYREHDAFIDGDDIYVTDDVASDLVDHVAAVNAMGPSMIGFDTPTAWLKLDEAIVMVTAGTSRQGVILIEQVIVAEPADDHWHLLTRPFAWEKVDPT